MKGLVFKYQLTEYIHNRLDLKEYEAFFDQMDQMDPVQLQQLIAEVLEQEDSVMDNRLQLPNLTQIHQKVLQNVYDIDPPKNSPSHKISYWVWASCAALLLCVFSVLYIMHVKTYKDTFETPRISWYENTHSYAVDTQLPDSTIVILYPNAKISFEQSVDGYRAIKQVQGKVIYKVHKNPNSPFIVNYMGYVTTALGTVFSVDPKSRENILIKLLEGKVSVGHIDAAQEDLIYLNKNEEVLVDLRLGKMTKLSENVLEKSRLTRVDKKLRELIPSFKPHVEWTNQMVEFSQIKNIQLLEVIENLYEVSVICESPELLSNSFTGSLNRDESLEKFLTNFCQLNGCSFRLDNGIIYLSNSSRKEGRN